ncbi:hypothetical protein [Tolypothrix sp. VBCCA 56010]|uniref:hypothetical protein n=1 Tax=Tolypothrix sp. VBCCA 56010 TaxID=3137731 RepID=UPI003D7DEDF3
MRRWGDKETRGTSRGGVPPPLPMPNAPCPMPNAPFPIYAFADATARSEREYLSRMNIEVASLGFF